MARKRSKQSTIYRIQYYNKQLDKQNRVSVSKKLSVKELNQLERDVKSTVFLRRADIEVDAKNVDRKNVERFRQLSLARKRQDTETFQKELNKLRRGNKQRLENIKSGLADVGDIGRVEFVAETLTETPQNETDIDIIIGAIADEDFSAKLLIEEVKKLNEEKGVKDIGGVTLDNIRELDSRAKQYIKNIMQSPKIMTTVAEDEAIIID